MVLKDYLRTIIFRIKNKKKYIIMKEKNIIKKSFFEGKNILGKENKIINSEIGFGTYMSSNNSFDLAKIGKYCSIGSNISIITGSHPLKKNISTHPAFFLANNRGFNKINLSYIKEDKFNDRKLVDGKWNTIIGNDVWIGSDVRILQGIKIGDGAVIAAGAVVVKDVEPYTIVGGVAAKEIRKRFLESDIKFLLDLKWWDKGEEWIKINGNYFEDIELLKEKIK